MYFKKRGCFSGRKKTVNVWVWIFLRFFFRRLEDLEDSRKEMYGQYEDPRCFKSVFRIDSFLSTAISKFHIPVYTMCAVIISLFVLLSRLFGRAAISDLFYIQFLSSESPSRLCHSLERVKCLEEYRWKWRTLSFTFDKEHRRKWPFNGNLEERERETAKYHLARITFFGGIRLKPVKFIRTLHTGGIYAGPLYAAGCGHNFEKRLGYADNSPRNVLDNSFPNGPKPNS